MDNLGSDNDEEEETIPEPDPFYGFTSDEALEAKQKARKTEPDPFHGFTSDEAREASNLAPAAPKKRQEMRHCWKCGLAKNRGKWYYNLKEEGKTLCQHCYDQAEQTTLEPKSPEPDPNEILGPNPPEPVTGAPTETSMKPTLEDPETDEGTPSKKPETEPSNIDLFGEPHSKEEDGVDSEVETNDFIDDDLQPEQDFRFAHGNNKETGHNNDDESESDDETGLPKRVRFST